MKYVDEYRDPGAVRAMADAIARAVTRPWNIMEVCGGQTHAIARFGLEDLLPRAVTLLHGPGCPVCVTPAETLDLAVELARRPEVTLCTYGDMLRVPGTRADLRSVKAAGGDVWVVYSPLDALALARTMPSREVVFLAVGFETTAPGHAMTLAEARREGVRNFSMLTAHVLVPPALRAIVTDPECVVDGFLAAGHVCTITGTREYVELAAREHVPLVVTGFEPLDILHGILLCVRQLEAGRAEVEIPYARAVRPEGNPSAQALLREVFTVIPQRWRGLGEIDASGLGIAPAYAAFDAVKRFGLDSRLHDAEPTHEECQSGRVLIGRIKPPECPHFGTRCTPETPLGATMVSSEGACAAYFRYRRSA